MYLGNPNSDNTLHLIQTNGLLFTNVLLIRSTKKFVRQALCGSNAHIHASLILHGLEKSVAVLVTNLENGGDWRFYGANMSLDFINHLMKFVSCFEKVLSEFTHSKDRKPMFRTQDDFLIIEILNRFFTKEDQL